jgi:U4/U6.U5 tri-snRNP-associated protein 1
MSDYLQEGDRGFKKPKVSFCLINRNSPTSDLTRTIAPQTKKKRPSRRVRDDEDPQSTSAAAAANGGTNGGAMEVDQKPMTKREVDLNVNFVDDEDLQAALARQRRAKMKERKVLKIEDIAKRGKFV